MIRRESTTHSEASNAAFAWCNPNGMENPVSEILRNRQASCESAFLFIGWANRKPYRMLRLVEYPCMWTPRLESRAEDPRDQVFGGTIAMSIETSACVRQFWRMTGNSE